MATGIFGWLARQKQPLVSLRVGVFALLNVTLQMSFGQAW